MKTALVLEGGAMRGMYTAGVLDVFMDAGLHFDGVIGVSAGALFGMNFISGQKGRALRYNKKFNRDRDYMGIRPLLREGNIVSTDYAYGKVPLALDPFDNEAFMKNPTPFYAVMTDIKAGKPEYVRIRNVFEQVDCLRASGSMPYVSRPVPINGKKYLDGAITDSIPYDFMLSKGYDRLVVVLTKCDGYRKEPASPIMADLRYGWRYPELAARIKRRHIMYNAQLSRLKRLERRGVADVLRPSAQVELSKTERNPEKLEALYRVGVADAKAYLSSRGPLCSERNCGQK